MREIAVQNRVWKSTLSASRKLVLIRMIWFANGEAGRCTAAQATLAEETGLDRKTICAAIRELLALGWLVQLKAATKREAAEYGVRVPERETAPIRGGNGTPLKRGKRHPSDGESEGEREGETAPTIGAIGAIGSKAAAEREEEPSHSVEGVPPLKPVEYETVGYLQSLETDASGRLQPHRDSFAAIELALRQGRTREWLEALMQLGIQRGVKALSWSWLLGTSRFAVDLRAVVDRDHETNQRTRRVLNMDSPLVKLTMEERDERAKRLLELSRQEREQRKAAK